MPEKINWNYFTLRVLKELIEHPQEGAQVMTCRALWSDINERLLGGISPSISYWVLMTKDVLPNTRRKKYDEQVGELRRYQGYEVPKILEAATGILNKRNAQRREKGCLQTVHLRLPDVESRK